MKYLMLLYGAEDVGPQPGTPEHAAEMQEWFAITQEMAEAGIMAGGEALHEAATATTIRVRDGATQVTDGPFAETKEVLGGFYLIDVENLDEATKWAEKIPSVPYGSVEIRPVMVFEEE